MPCPLNHRDPVEGIGAFSIDYEANPRSDGATGDICLTGSRSLGVSGHNARSGRYPCGRNDQCAPYKRACTATDTIDGGSAPKREVIRYRQVREGRGGDGCRSSTFDLTAYRVAAGVVQDRQNAGQKILLEQVVDDIEIRPDDVIQPCATVGVQALVNTIGVDGGEGLVLGLGDR